MSGTPLDLTPFGPVLSAIGWLYWLVAFAILVFAWWLPKALWQKLSAVAIAVAAVYLVFVRPVQTRELVRQQQHQESNAKLDEAMALFKKRCESAGEKIVRTVESVDGVVWMKWREPISNADNFADQFKLNDPYGQDCGAADCLLKLLRVPKGMEEFSAEAARHIFGYRYVESFDPTDQSRYRYVGTLRPHPNWTPDKISQRKQDTGRDLDHDSYTFQLTKAPVANGRVALAEPNPLRGRLDALIEARAVQAHAPEPGECPVKHGRQLVERVGWRQTSNLDGVQKGAPWNERSFEQTPHQDRV